MNVLLKEGPMAAKKAEAKPGRPASKPMRRAITIAVCSFLTLGLIASVILIAAVVTFAKALAGAFAGAIVGIGAAISMVLLIFVIPVFVALAWLLSADWPTFFSLVRKVLELLGWQ